MQRKFPKASVAILGLAALALVALPHQDAQAREQIRIVGSSTVFPFTTTVAERFGRNTKFRTPIVEGTGTGGGISLFCAGSGVQTPDIVNASRRIMPSELAQCEKNGVTGIIETAIGFDGIVLANAADSAEYHFKIEHLYLALAKQVPVDGKLVANPYETWQQIDDSLPNEPIVVYGPPTTSGTRDAFLELGMEPGCKKFPEIQALEADAQRQVCHTIREDGKFIDAGENDNVIVQRLQTSPRAVGVFGFSYLQENLATIKAATIDGVEATFETIMDASYPVARSMYLYTKKQHIGVIPGLQEFLTEYTSEEAVGEYGYLSDRGLIPLLEELQAAQRSIIINLETMNKNDILQNN